MFKTVNKPASDVQAGDTISLLIDRDYINSLRNSGVPENKLPAWLLSLRLGLRRKFRLRAQVAQADQDCLYLRSFWLGGTGDFCELRQDYDAQRVAA